MLDWEKNYYDTAARNGMAGRKPVIGITANFGEYGSQLAEAYYESVRIAGGVPVIVPASEVTADLDDVLLRIDALIFSGGGDINPLLLGDEPDAGLGGINGKRDLQELVLMRRALDKQMPVLGICRGIQVMAAATGGKLIQDLKTQLKHSQKADRHVATHSVELKEGSMLRSIFGCERLEVNSFHHQAVAEPGNGMRIAALSPDGVIEAIESTEYKSVIGVQWHPESFFCLTDNRMLPLFRWLISEAAEYKEAKRIHSRVLTLDTHCDTPMFFHEDIDFARKDDRILVDSVKMRDGGLDASIMVAYLPQGERDDASLVAATHKADELLDGIEQRIASAPGVGLANTPTDLRRLKTEGILAIMRGIENGYAIGRDLSNVERFRKRGVVYMTLCHNGDNDICDSASRTNNEHGGLSAFGREVVKEMNRVGMMVDLSHGGVRSFYDALELSAAPIVCSHASCRALCDHPRNLDDEQMRALARKGGVMQVTLYPGFLRLDGEATILDAMAHLDHAIEVMGVDAVGLGTDFDGDGGVPGLASASELINFTRQLLRRRYNEADIASIWGGNFLRVMDIVQRKGDCEEIKVMCKQ
ncbi:MAG: membrane dipeptidase [Bacteroidaceae bacterium]|nr:membrane dipeptidase [Bacteroidaceae bacterium]